MCIEAVDVHARKWRIKKIAALYIPKKRFIANLHLSICQLKKKKKKYIYIYIYIYTYIKPRAYYRTKRLLVD